MISYQGKDWKVCVVTPAGRKYHLETLKKYIYKEMDNGLVDLWQLWENTGVSEDIEYLRQMVHERKGLALIDQGFNEYSGFNIYSFYKFATDPDTIYLRFDDDIVFVEDGAIEKLIRARIENPLPFVICANIVNNTIISKIHQDIGALDIEHGIAEFERMGLVAHRDPIFAENVHATFKKKFSEKKLSEYYFPNVTLENYEPFSISCFAFFGRDLAYIDHADEEMWISHAAPRIAGRPCMILGDALVVHYGYHTQREALDKKPEIYQFYEDIWTREL